MLTEMEDMGTGRYPQWMLEALEAISDEEAGEGPGFSS